MASIRPSRSSLSPSSTTAETWAVRVAFGLMIAGMGGFVVYDFMAPGPSERSASDDEPVVEERAAEAVQPAQARAPSMKSRPPRHSSLAKEGRSRMPAFRRAVPETETADEGAEMAASRGETSRDEASEAPSDRVSNRRSGLRTFLGSPGARLRPAAEGMVPQPPRPAIVARTEQETPPPEPPPPPEPEPDTAPEEEPDVAEPDVPEEDTAPEEEPVEASEEQPEDEAPANDSPEAPAEDPAVDQPADTEAVR